jgi:hypothetical protein
VAQRRSDRKPFAVARQASPASRRTSYVSTGSFGAFRAPRVVGVSDDVRVSTDDLARRASREMRRWKRTLPKGVRNTV